MYIYSSWFIKIINLLLLTVFLTACGSGDSDTDLNVNTDSVSFSAILGGAAPAPQIYSITWSRDDVATIVIGFTPELGKASWLNITESGNTSSPIIMTLEVNTGSLNAGIHRTTVRIISTTINFEAIDTIDVPVTLTISN